MTHEVLNELALFGGAGGGILGGRLLGWRCVCAVEHDRYAAAVVAQRQNDGMLHAFPIWDDVRTFDGRPWRGRVDVVSGGFPCTDISVAGRGAGIEGPHSGLWSEFARIIREVRPQWAFVENSPALTVRGLGTVLADLAALGYDAEWGVFGADEAALASHRGEIPLIHNRDRIWIVGRRSGADTDGVGQLQPEGRQPDVGRRVGDVGKAAIANADDDRFGVSLQSERFARGGIAAAVGRNGQAQLVAARGGAVDPPAFADAKSERRHPRQLPIGADTPQSVAGSSGSTCNWWSTEPDVDRVVSRMAYRVDRLRAIGNGQVPAVAAFAWHTLVARLGTP